jgi:hypothetical protein
MQASFCTDAGMPVETLHAQLSTTVLLIHIGVVGTDNLLGCLCLKETTGRVEKKEFLLFRFVLNCTEVLGLGLRKYL